MLARAQMGTIQTQQCFTLGIWAQFGIIYFLIYAKYWGIFHPHHALPKILEMSIWLPVDMSKILLDE